MKRVPSFCVAIILLALVSPVSAVLTVDFHNQRFFVREEVLGLKSSDLQLSFERLADLANAPASQPLRESVNQTELFHKIMSMLKKTSQTSLGKALFQYDVTDKRTLLKITSINRTRSKTTVRLGQYVVITKAYDPIPVEGSNLVLIADQKGNIQFVKSGLVLRRAVSHSDLEGAVTDIDARNAILKILSPYREQMFESAKLGKPASKRFVQFFSKLEKFTSGIRPGNLNQLLLTAAREGSLRYVVRSVLEGGAGSLVTRFVALFDLPIIFEISRIDKKRLDVRYLGSSVSSLSVEFYYPKDHGSGAPDFESQAKPFIVASQFADFEQSSESESIKMIGRIFWNLIEFYKKEFQIDSFDNRGSVVNAVVEVKQKDMIENAGWDGNSRRFYIGAGSEFVQKLGQASDVLGHEYFHAVEDFTSDLISENQSGGIAEHGADIMGLLFELSSKPKIEWPGDFAIGETIFTDAFRSQFREATGRELISLRNLVDATAAYEELPKDLTEALAKYDLNCIPNEENDRCGVHYLSGIPNKAIGNSIHDFAVQKFQGNFKKSLRFTAGTIYETFASRLKNRSNFIEYFGDLMDVCLEKVAIVNLSKDDCKIFEDNFRTVGVVRSHGGKQDVGGEAGDNIDATFRRVCELYRTVLKDQPLPDFCKNR